MSAAFRVRKPECMDMDNEPIYGSIAFCCIRIVHGGLPVGTPVIDYLGGVVNIIDMVEEEGLTLNLMKEMVMHIGEGRYDEDVELFYKIPNVEVQNGGLRLITAATSVKMLLKEAKDKGCVTLYVKHAVLPFSGLSGSAFYRSRVKSDDSHNLPEESTASSPGIQN